MFLLINTLKIKVKEDTHLEIDYQSKILDYKLNIYLYILRRMLIYLYLKKE
jgi:hypothetical protein